MAVGVTLLVPEHSGKELNGDHRVEDPSSRPSAQLRTGAGTTE